MILTSYNLGEIILDKSTSIFTRKNKNEYCDIQTYQNDTFKIFSGNFCFKEDVTINVKNDISEVVSFYNLSGNRFTNYSDLKNTLTINTNEHNILCSNNNFNQLFLPKNINHQSLVIYCNPKKYIELTENSTTSLDSFLYNISNQRSSIAKAKNMKLTPEMVYLAMNLKNQIIANKNNLLIKGSIYNLLGLQAENTSTKVTKGITSSDENKLEEARIILLNNFSITIDELSKSIGMNITKFKNLFKQLYGVPAKGYQFNYRMELAKRHLIEGVYNVTEIGYIIGYEYPEHFTRGFKKHFGYPPSKLKMV